METSIHKGQTRLVVLKLTHPTRPARGDFVTKAADRPIPSLHLTGTCDGEAPGVELVNRGPIITKSPVIIHPESMT
jgi:hypothetical protein